LTSLFVVALLAGEALLAQPAATPPAAETSQSRVAEGPHLDLSPVDATARIRAWESLRLAVAVHAGVNPSGIGVNSITLNLPHALGLKVAKSPPTEEENAISQPFELREPGTKVELPPVEVEPLKLHELGWNGLLSILTYRAGKETIVAVLRYRRLDEPSVILVETTRLDVNVSGHPGGMYAGALTGAFLIALFLAIARRSATHLRWQALRRIAGSFLLRFVRGGIATAIAILVLQTTSDIRFPITVSVEDFYGGVLLGLFGDQVAQAIEKRILNKPDKKSD
jgi:hypothetical protein